MSIFVGHAPSLHETRHREYITRSTLWERHETEVEHNDVDDIVRSFRSRNKKNKIFNVKYSIIIRQMLPYLEPFLHYI